MSCEVRSKLSASELCRSYTITQDVPTYASWNPECSWAPASLAPGKALSDGSLKKRSTAFMMESILSLFVPSCATTMELEGGSKATKTAEDGCQ